MRKLRLSNRCEDRSLLRVAAAPAAPLLPFPAAVPPTVFTKQPSTRSNSFIILEHSLHAPAKRDIGTNYEKLGS